MTKKREIHDCNDCGAEPGELHDKGFDVERCALCGGQAIGCGCVTKFESPFYDDSEDHSAEAYAKLDAFIESLGGRLPWTGFWPDVEYCQEFNLWTSWVPGKGWVSCEKDHPKATEELNRLQCVTKWDPVARKRVLR